MVSGEDDDMELCGLSLNPFAREAVISDNLIFLEDEIISCAHEYEF
jgi:hypothetical protein